jgi:hypothetical protein
MRLLVRHWTAILILLVLAGWALFYLPDTPSWAIFQLKQAIDSRDGNSAARHVDFEQVVHNAGREMVQGENGGGDPTANLLGQLIGNAAVELFSAPMAALLRQWAIKQVDDGAKQVQMPGAAVAGALVLMHREGSSAYTRWTDRKGQVWEVQLSRENGGWKVTQVRNIRQLLEKLRRHEEKQFAPPNSAVPPETVPPPSSVPPPYGVPPVEQPSPDSGV